MELLQFVVLAAASAFWPILIAIDLVALRSPKPALLLGWFLAGGLLTTISQGLVIVFVLEGSTLGSKHRSTVGWVSLGAGIAALIAAAFLRSKGPTPRGEPATRGRWVHAITNGRGYAFGAGVVLNLLPGIFPLLALRDIAALDSSRGVKVVLVVVLYLIMFAFIEVPLVGLLVAPARTEPMVQALNRWLDRYGRRLGIDVLAAVGIYLVARGLAQLT